ncbi:hypothetical protein FB451DRAFT_192185 [Mycena latifolia]|nr:hypothetical protein FB451DRAFT_192185 [Mycena latifolia]
MPLSAARHTSENLGWSSSPATTGSQLRARLIEIENQVAGLETQLSRLRVEKQAVLDSLESVIYPILTLPPEITSEVFLNYVDSHPSHSPLCLASVCRAWRAVALSVAALWTHFQAGSSNAGSNFPAENLANRLRCWLPRAGSLRLTLRIVLPGLSSQDDTFSILAEHASQWMDLNLTSDTALSFPVGSIHAPLSSLKKVRLDIHVWPDAGRSCILAFLDAPQLRDVEIYGLSFPQISLPWIQLTILKLEGQSVAQCLEILEHSPHLEELSVTASFLSWGAPPALTPRTLLRLRTLKLSSDPDVELLGHLTLPALDSLDLSELSDSGLTRVLASSRAPAAPSARSTSSRRASRRRTRSSQTSRPRTRSGCTTRSGPQTTSSTSSAGSRRAQTRCPRWMCCISMRTSATSASRTSRTCLPRAACARHRSRRSVWHLSRLGRCRTRRSSPRWNSCAVCASRGS